jgi:transposase InsO family protein
LPASKPVLPPRAVLRIDDGRCGVGGTADAVAQSLTKPFVPGLEGACVCPAAEGLVDRAPARERLGQRAPVATGEHDAEAGVDEQSSIVGRWRTATAVALERSATSAHSGSVRSVFMPLSASAHRCRPVWPIRAGAAHKEYGLTDRIRTDNGVPFAAPRLDRLSQLSEWWLKLGVLPELTEPGKPQNGRHERMSKTLKDEATKPPAGNGRAQQRKFNSFRQEFNEVRPHEALDMNTPAQLHQPSSRPMPSKLQPMEYPDRFEVRSKQPNSKIKTSLPCWLSWGRNSLAPHRFAEGLRQTA